MNLLKGLKLKNINELDKYNLVILDDLGINIDNKIPEILNKKGLTPADLSRMTGIARQNLNEILKGKLSPGVDFALKISIALGVNLEEVFQLKDNAWVRRLSGDDGILYLDLYSLEIKDGRVNREIKNSKDYIILEEKKIIDEAEYKELFKKYYDENYNIIYEEIAEKYPYEVKQRKNWITKETINEKFNKVCTNRYKKLGVRLIPLINNK